MIIMSHENFMQYAFDEASKGIKNDLGGPFGAVVVYDGKIIGKGCNMVTSLNDPSAHAEIVAIRQACKNQNNFHLTDAIIYTTCEPCPMCLAAIYWADIKKIYYSSDRNDAERIGFGDKFIYDEFSKDLNERSIGIERLVVPNADNLFKEWVLKDDKTLY